MTPSPQNKSRGAAPSMRMTKEMRRRSTYYRRKSEVEQLRRQIASLQHRVENMALYQQQTLQDSLAQNSLLRLGVKNGDLAVASVQSLVGGGMQQQLHDRLPLGSHIRLPKDIAERERVLAAHKQDKIYSAIADVFETETGGFVTTQWDVTPLDDAVCVRQAFDEIVYFTENQEIALSEKFSNGLMIRESDMVASRGVYHARMLVTQPDGANFESNVAMFTQYFDRSELLDRPHALMVTESIEEDELFPYDPRQRIRKDVSGIAMVTEIPSSIRAKPRVVMLRCAVVRVHQNTNFDHEIIERDAHESVSAWCSAMLQCVRERLKRPGASTIKTREHDNKLCCSSQFIGASNRRE